jgi:hypothetical protein
MPKRLFDGHKMPMRNPQKQPGKRNCVLAQYLGSGRRDRGRDPDGGGANSSMIFVPSALFERKAGTRGVFR